MAGRWRQLDDEGRGKGGPTDEIGPACFMEEKAKGPMKSVGNGASPGVM